MLGTAAVVDVWLLLEYRPAWRPKAMTDNALGEAVRDWLAYGIEALEGQGYRVRPQFIRQPEIDRSGHATAGSSRWGCCAPFGSGGPGYDGLLRTADRDPVPRRVRRAP